MHNTFKTILIVIIILAFSTATFFIGFFVGMQKFASTLKEEMRLKIINEIASRIEELPTNIINEPPKNILWGTINRIDTDEIIIVAKPTSITDALWQEPSAHKIQITPDTKIFYLSLDITAVPYPSLPNATIHNLKTTDLKKDELVYIKLDPNQTNRKLKALEIKVNR